LTLCLPPKVPEGPIFLLDDLPWLGFCDELLLLAKFKLLILEANYSIMSLCYLLLFYGSDLPRNVYKNPLY
jgi:hypothetical protein